MREWLQMFRLAWWPLLLLVSGIWLAAATELAGPGLSANSECPRSAARVTIHAAHHSGGQQMQPGLVDDDASDDDDLDGDDVLQPSTSGFALPRHPPPAEIPASSLRVCAVRLREHRRLIERPPTT